MNNEKRGRTAANKPTQRKRPSQSANTRKSGSTSGRVPGGRPPAQGRIPRNPSQRSAKPSSSRSERPSRTPKREPQRPVSPSAERTPRSRDIKRPTLPQRNAPPKSRTGTVPRQPMSAVPRNVQKRAQPKRKQGNVRHETSNLGYQQRKRYDNANNRTAGRNSRVQYEKPRKSSLNYRQKREPVKRLRRKAERNSSAVLAVAGVFIFIVVVVYLAIYTVRTMSITTIKTETVKLGAIEMPYSAQGIVVRDEKAFASPAVGLVEYNFADNEKIKSSQTVCLVKNMENMENMETDLEKIDERLLEMQSYRNELSAGYENFKKYNVDIAAAADTLAADISKKNTTALLTLKDNIFELWAKRNTAVLSDNSGSAQELSGLRQEKESQISGQISSIKNDKGGIVSYYVDGYEDKINFESVSKGDMVSQDVTEENGESFNMVKSMAEADSPVFKMVYSNEWYIAAYIETEYITNWEPEDYVTIYITGKTQSAKPSRAYIANLQKGDKLSYAVFKMDGGLIDYITDRFVSVKVKKADEGYKILKSAVAEQNLLKIPKKYVLCDDEEAQKNNIEPYVIKVTDKGTQNVDVKISAEDESKTYYYVQIEFGKINVGTVLKDPDESGKTFKASDIVTEKGVYITNSGITRFRKIDTTDSVSNDTHIVLDIEKNPYIEIYDKYAADASSVYDDERTVKPSI